MIQRPQSSEEELIERLCSKEQLGVEKVYFSL